jgi:hypothetical protein
MPAHHPGLNGPPNWTFMHRFPHCLPSPAARTSLLMPAALYKASASSRHRPLLRSAASSQQPTVSCQPAASGGHRAHRRSRGRLVALWGVQTPQVVLVLLSTLAVAQARQVSRAAAAPQAHHAVRSVGWRCGQQPGCGSTPGPPRREGRGVALRAWRGVGGREGRGPGRGLRKLLGSCCAAEERGWPQPAAMRAGAGDGIKGLLLMLGGREHGQTPARALPAAPGPLLPVLHAGGGGAAAAACYLPRWRCTSCWCQASADVLALGAPDFSPTFASAAGLQAPGGGVCAGGFSNAGATEAWCMPRPPSKTQTPST